jgi:DNA-binding winged helix-turn-helix (wHTH) protein
VTSALRFGRFEWLPDSRELRSDGRAISIGRRAADVLGFLIRYRERLVTKEELLDYVWAGLVVEENNLQVQISALRKLLGPQAIVTIPGRGYRFVAVVDGPAALKDAQTAELPRATPGSSAGGDRSSRGWTSHRSTVVPTTCGSSTSSSRRTGW